MENTKTGENPDGKKRKIMTYEEYSALEDEYVDKIVPITGGMRPHFPESPDPDEEFDPEYEK